MAFSFLSILQQFSIGLIGLSFLVFIHEGGHFLAARLFKIKVNTFSIGFGKTLWSRKWGKTLYCIKLIPFGGFVAMEGEQSNPQKELSQPQDNSFSFSQKPIWQRIIVALSGPFINIIFAFILLAAIYTQGVLETKPHPVIIKSVLPGSPAENTGLKPNDQIILLGETKVNSLPDFIKALQLNGTKATGILVLRKNKRKMLVTYPKENDFTIVEIGVRISGEGVKITKIIPNSPAEMSGLKENDHILKVNQQPIRILSEFITYIQKSPAQLPIMIEYQRNQKILTTAIVPNLNKQNKNQIGVQISPLSVRTEWTHSSLFKSLELSYHSNVRQAKLIFLGLKKLFTNEVSIKDMSGPVGIAQIMGIYFQSSFKQFLLLLCFISLNLGIMNLLPLAITDGGLILFLILEGIRKKPLSMSLQQKINQVTTLLFVLLALFITFQDILRIPSFLP